MVSSRYRHSIVTSSSWRCKTGLTAQEARDFTKPSFDAALWPPAFEEGNNGILPWGERPGIAKSAFWIFSADAYKMKGTTAYCRVDTNDAWHSYSKKHLAASRWSCKSMQNRQSPYVINLNSDTSLWLPLQMVKTQEPISLLKLQLVHRRI